MMRLILIFSVSIVCLAVSGISIKAWKESGSSKLFKVAEVYFEQNATDGDAEVVFEVKGRDEGLINFKVVSPNGRTVVDFTADDSSTLGIRQLRFETPEPKDVDSLKSAYPEGLYTFAGTTMSGSKLNGEATLSHTLPKTSSFLQLYSSLIKEFARVFFL